MRQIRSSSIGGTLTGDDGGADCLALPALTDRRLLVELRHVSVRMNLQSRDLREVKRRFTSTCTRPILDAKNRLRPVILYRISSFFGTSKRKSKDGVVE